MALSVGSFPASLSWKHQWAQRSPVLKSLFLSKHWLMLSLMFSDGRCRCWPWILQGPQTVCFGCVLWSQTRLQPVLSRICSSVLLPVWICPHPKMPSQPTPRTAGHYVSHSTLGIGTLPAELLLAHRVSVRSTKPPLWPQVPASVYLLGRQHAQLLGKSPSG